MKHSRLITILFFAAMLLILGLLVANVTSCAPLPSATAQTVSTVTPKDGTIYHPYLVDATPYGNNDMWDVLTVKGHEKWREPDALYVIHSGDYIFYQGQEYQVSGINYKALTMGVVILGS